MLWKELMLLKFEDKGFRILTEQDPDDKFFVVDDIELNIGNEYRVGPNGYFELSKEAST